MFSVEQDKQSKHSSLTAPPLFPTLGAVKQLNPVSLSAVAGEKARSDFTDHDYGSGQNAESGFLASLKGHSL